MFLVVTFVSFVLSAFGCLYVSLVLFHGFGLADLAVTCFCDLLGLIALVWVCCVLPV